ncbi:FGGY-family carbohydrate kinase [Actinomadura rayongensis]|uniref:Carbohydrate kinase n=1 Tax=Actinomadura rayongensis TaxID=1429076 RepID=A0A6I4W2X6_9ACTN|nr:FGGY family carbohydrate kinase [Actinomadura rayongensis]MXQ63801.1 carbohydrate kinase [Actinomadura rayongensis]
MDVFLGVDVGTQGVRAVAVSRAGALAGHGAVPLTGSRDGPRHEQDPAAWWTASVEACRLALRSVPAGSVRAVAVDGTSGTILLTDRHGRPLTPALMYDDTRATAYVERVNEVGRAVWDSLGYRRMHAAWALPKLLWLLDRHPSGRAAHPVDVVNRRLVGHAVPTDVNSALKTGAHTRDVRWPHEVLDALGVPASALPDLVRPGTVIGAVGAAGSAATGLPPGVPVVAGTTDGCAALLASGRVGAGSWNSALGTTLVLKGVTTDPVQDPSGIVYSHRGPDGGWLPGGASGAGGGVLARDFPGRDLAALDRRASLHEPARALAYPLTASGERFPFAAPSARGFVLGDFGPDDRYAALLQGVAYIERLCLDYLDLLGAPIDGALTFTGGATASPYWCSLRASILNRPVTLPTRPEPALGAAILAAWALSPTHRLADVAAEMVRISATIDPHAPGRFDATYLQLVDELASRGWLPTTLASHAHQRLA